MESLSDIVAEMRGEWAKCYYAEDSMRSDGEYPEGHEDIDTQALADRIEAAWKRQMSQSWHHREMEELIAKHEMEVAELKNQAGNAAAMREALVAIGETYREHPYDHDDDAIANIVDVALSAPARNCDLPLVVDGPADTNANRAWHVFKCRNPGAYFDVPGLLRCIDWLLAPAAERKGEVNGR